VLAFGGSFFRAHLPRAVHLLHTEYSTVFGPFCLLAFIFCFSLALSHPLMLPLLRSLLFIVHFYFFISHCNHVHYLYYYSNVTPLSIHYFRRNSSLKSSNRSPQPKGQYGTKKPSKTRNVTQGRWKTTAHRATLKKTAQRKRGKRTPMPPREI